MFGCSFDFYYSGFILVLFLDSQKVIFIVYKYKNYIFLTECLVISFFTYCVTFLLISGSFLISRWNSY